MAEAMTVAELEEIEALIDRQLWLKEHNKIDDFVPYRWQKKLYQKDDGNGEPAMQRLAMCFGGTSQVWMTDGSTKPIEDVEVGESILSWSKERGLFPTKVRQKSKRWVEDPITISYGTFDKHDLVTTRDHKFLTSTRNLKPLSEYKNSDSFKHLDKQGIFGTVFSSFLSFKEVNLSPAEPQYVYCLGVEEEPHLFVVNGFIVSNCANRVGKTFGGAAEMSYHLTGRYPEWWEGHRFEKPINAWACGVSSDTTRDILQTALLGDPEGGEESWGTGSIPVDCLLPFNDKNAKVIKRGATSGTLYSVRVKHVSGGYSICLFKAYEQGEEKFMGKSLDFIWLDEEPPGNIYTQCITRTADSNGLVLMTFTPESGMTSTVNQFLNDIKPGQKLVQATWEDVDHLDDRTKVQLLAQYTPAERDMRSKGIPIFGSGLVFTVPEDDIRIDPIPLPNHWPRIAGLDFGWDHPTAVVWLAHDPEQDVLYVYDCYRKSKENVITHASSIRSRGVSIPVAWPHDGMSHDKGSGKGLAQQYRDEGVNMLPQHFTNPPVDGEKVKYNSRGNINVEPGIAAMLKRMEQDKFKVFSTCPEWFEEFRLYHRKEGKIVAEHDDLMSATRYGHQSLRYARQVDINNPTNTSSAPLNYDSRGIV